MYGTAALAPSPDVAEVPGPMSVKCLKNLDDVGLRIYGVGPLKITRLDKVKVQCN